MPCRAELWACAVHARVGAQHATAQHRAAEHAVHRGGAAQRGRGRVEALNEPDAAAALPSLAARYIVFKVATSLFFYARRAGALGCIAH